MRALLAFPLIALLANSPALANEVETVSSPTEADYAVADSLAQSILGGMKLGNVDNAFDEAFNRNPLVDQIRGQLPVLVGQVGTTLNIYGPISRCELASRSHLGSMLIRLTYACQHERFMTRWDFRVVETANGWIVGSVKFEDAE